jgi:uncharacterized membrane protein
MALVWAMLGYAVFFGWWSLRKYAAFQAPGFDLGIYDQGLWLLSRFKSPFITLMGLNLFGDHESFILLALVPLYWVWPDPQALLVVQSMALALGAIPLFLLAQKVLKRSSTALLPALTYLMLPALGWLNLENFHPDSFGVPLLLFALYFMACSRWRAFFVSVFLALLVKEDVFLVVVPLGIYLMCRRQWGVGLLTCALAAAWFPLVFLVIQPMLSGTGAGHLDAWRIPFGGMGGLIRTTFKAPWDVVTYTFTAEKAKYLVQLFAPLLFLPWRTARTLVVVPVVAFNLVSTFWYQSSLHYHYTSLIIPFIIVAFVYSLERFKSPRRRRLAARWVLGATIVSVALWGPGPLAMEAASLQDTGDPQVLAARRAVALIPGDAVVAARDKFASHLAHRDQVYVFPTPFAAASWGDESDHGKELSQAESVDFVLNVADASSGDLATTTWGKLSGEGFVKIFDQAGVVLLRRQGAGPSATGQSALPE